MATSVTSLHFSTEDHSLWHNGKAISFSIDSGDFLIYDPEEVTYDFDVDIGVAGASAQAYLDFKIGLLAYADLGSTGGFDASYNLLVNVDHPTAINALTTNSFDVDFSDYQIINATIDSEAFGAGAGAGLDVVLGAQLGIRDIEWFAFGFSGEVDDLNFVDIDTRIPIIAITPTTELEVELTEGLNLIGRLPTGAETHGLSAGSTKVSSAGFSETKFIELDADLDALLMRLIEKIPAVGQVLGAVGEFLFAEHEFDLHDYISAVPADKIKLGITAIDIGASAGLVITEDLSLDIGNGTNIPDIDIVLRSDNGTPLDFSDDVIQQGKLGGAMNVPTATAIGGDRVATQQLTAYYDLASVDYYHAVGLGINTSITIDILKGELKGAWVPDALSFSFGPLFSAEFPDGGLQFKLGDIYTDEFALDTGGFTNAQSGTDPTTWNYQAGAFNQETDTYDVFVTDAPPVGWDPEAPNAMQVLYTYIEAQQQNLTASVNTFGDLWNNAGSQTNRFLAAGEQYGPGSPGYAASNVSLFWFGAEDGISVNAPREAGNNNFAVIDLSNAAANTGRSDTFLAVDIAPDATPANDGDDNTNPFSTNPIQSPFGVKFNSSIHDKAGLLDNMDDAAFARYIHWTDDQSFQKIFSSVLTPNVIGTGNGDVIVHFGDDGLPRLYDGAGERQLVTDTDFEAQGKLGFDTFVGNFLATNPNDPINFDARQADYQTNNDYATDGITIAGNVTVRNFESFVLRTGNEDDFVTDGIWDDWFETSGGNDLITIVLDSKSDYAFGGADDDAIYADFSLSNPYGYNTGAGADHLHGGTGDDLGVFRMAEYQDEFGNEIVARGFIFGNYLRIYVDGSTGDANQADYKLNNQSSIDDLFTGLDRHDGGLFGRTNGIQQTLWDSTFIPEADRDSISYEHEFEVNGLFHNPSTRFYADVDRVSYLGGNSTDDIALFNGGFEYFGGEGLFAFNDPNGDPVEILDTLIGDFGAYEQAMGVTSGVHLIAENRIGHTGPEQLLSFGGALIKGWERFVAHGTQYNDTFLGGRYNDGFDGGAGNDVIDGGEFDAFHGQPVQGSFEFITTNVDQLSGGAGDDTFYWSDDGADRIDGGTHANGDWLFVMPEAGSEGLEYGFFRDGHAYLGGVDKTPSFAIERDIILNAQSNSADILDGLGRLGGGTAHDGDANPQTSFDFGTGIRFGDTLGENIISTNPFVIDRFMDFQNIEHVNVSGTDAHSDLVYYQGGATYLGGEDPNGLDEDVFAADFSGDAFAIDLAFGDANDAGTFLGNGALIGGFERGIIKAGSAHDRLVGGDFHDIFYGGAGNDTLFAGAGGGRLFGEAGNDLVFWGGEAEVFAQGGTGDDHLIVGGSNSGLSYYFQDAGGTNLSGGIIDASSSLAALNAALGNLPAATEFQIFTNGQRIIYSEFEHVSIAGTDAADDLVIYQDGLVSIGGERVGDADIFAGNLSSETADLTLVASDRGDMSQVPGSGSDVFDPQSGQFTGDTGELRDIGNGNLVGGFERFNVQLGSGDDTVIGGLLQDTIRGGDGNDKLNSGTGGTLSERDYLGGDDGDDILTFSGGFAEFDGGAGDNDQLDFLIQTDALSYAIIDGGGNVVGSPFTAATNDRAAFGNFFSSNPFFSAGQYDFTGGSLRLSNMEHTALGGSSQSDFLFSTLRSGALFGGDGDDVIVSHLGLDNMLGGAGFDTYAFKSGFGRDTIARETVNGGRLYFEDLNQGDVTFFVSNGVDLHVVDPTASQVIIRDYFAEGGNGLDFTFDFVDFSGSIDLSGLPGIVPTGAPVFGVTETGSANDDEFLTQFSENDDTYYGLEGDDYFAGSRGADLFVGGPGSDTVSYYERGLGPVSVNLINREGTQGNADRDILLGIENLIGTAFNDSLLGDEIANTILGGAGDDLLRGFHGDDLLIGNEGDDTIEGAQGEDDLFGDDGADTVSGGEDDDYIAGGDGDDTLSGDGGDDILVGGAGNDTVTGGDGDDTYMYGLGDDPATDPLADIANNEAGVDTFDPGAGNDTADFSKFGFAVDVYLDNFAGGDEAFTDFMSTVVHQTFTFGLGVMEGVENVVGTDFDDIFNLQNADVSGFGGAGDDRFFGGQGSQTIVGGADFDTLDYSTEGGGSGIFADLFTGPNRIVVDTFGDTDTVAEIEKFIGTSMGDQFIGDALGNAFDSMGGFDVFSGKGGNDTFIATPDGANAILNGGDGFDTLDYSAFTQNVVFDVTGGEVRDNGGSTVGSDNIAGFERFVSSIGDDTAFGSNASEEFDLGNGNDFVGAGDGDDRVIAGEGNNNYNGDAGIDLIDYSRFTDPAGLTVFLDSGVAFKSSGTQDGLSGFENVVGSLGMDALRGTDGDNIFYYRADAGQGGSDQINGKGGFDIFDLSGFGAAVVLDWDAVVQVQTRDADNTLPASGALRNVGTLTSIEQVIVTDFADELRGTAGDDRLEGRDGDDILVGRDGEDELRGDSGSDTADYSQDGGAHGVLLDFAGVLNGTPFWRDTHNDDDTLVSVENAIGTDFNDVIIGDNNNNVFDGRGGADLIYGIAGQNILYGGDGNDDLQGGTDKDTIYGQNDDDDIQGHEGNDVLSGGAGDDTLDGGDGLDVADYRDSLSAVTINLNHTVISTTGGLGSDTFTSIEGAIGGDFNDKFFGKDNDNYFEGGAGADTFSTFGGVDVVLGGAGNDRVFLGTGNDTASGGEDSDTLNGQEDNDVLSGDAGNDRLYGGTGDDILMGGAGADLLVGNAGADTMDGGDGNDRLYVDGDDTPSNISGGAGSDRLIGLGSGDLTYVMHAHSLEGALGAAGNDTFDGSRLQQRTVMVGKDGNDILFGGSGNDLLEGRNDDDHLRGNDGVDFLTGQNGADLLEGGEGSDTLFGGNQDDVLRGDAGNDLLQGDAGSDTIAGGDGDDDVRVDSSDVQANITGGNGFDTLRLLGSDAYDFAFGGQGFERAFGNSAANNLDGSAASQGVTIYGLNGDDVLTGSLFDDSIIAGNDDDIVMLLAGADSAHGGNGTDTAVFAGNQADYNVNIVNAGVSVKITHLASGDINSLSFFEFAQFDDGTIAI